MVNTARYKIVVKTADEYQAGTDSNIFIVLYGEKGKTEEKRLNAYIKGNPFERNQKDECVVEFEDVGEVYKIDLRSDCRYAGAGWRVSYIEITKEGSTLSSNFLLKCWIEDKKTKTFFVDDAVWKNNKIFYDSKIVDYKRDSFVVPANSTYEYDREEKNIGGFCEANCITKKITPSIMQELDPSMSSQAFEQLESVEVTSDYLKYVYDYILKNTDLSNIFRYVKPEISYRFCQTLRNDTQFEQKYEVVYSVLKYDVVATFNDSIATAFSLNSKILCSGCILQ